MRRELGYGLSPHSIWPRYSPVSAFTIQGVRLLPEGAGSLILTRDDPGIRIEDGLIRLTHYPCWGIRGKCAFVIDEPKRWSAP